MRLAIFPEWAAEDLMAKGPSECVALGVTSSALSGAEAIGSASYVVVDDNVFRGNPEHGVSQMDLAEPDRDATPNTSRGNRITDNRFAGLDADSEIA